MLRLAASLVLAVMLLGACVDDRVPLAYGLTPGRRLEYRLELRAEIERSLSGSTRQQIVEATFRAAQEILELLPGGGTRAEMSLVPESLTVDGRPTQPGPGQRFTVELALDGRVAAIEEAEGQPEEALETVGLERLLPRLRPVLPGRLVGTGDTWTSDTTFTDQDGSFSLSTSSRLDRLGLAEGYRAAMVRTSYVSPVDRREVLSNAVADLEGRDVGIQEAWFALDGFLLRASGDSVGRYGITFSPPEGGDALPVEGALLVRLHTELRMIRS